MSGYIKLYRKSQNHFLYFAEPFTKWQARQDMLLLANHSDGSFFVRGIKVDVKRGQVARSEQFWADRRKWSRNKVRRFFSILETEHQVKQQKNAAITILEILNRETYQGNGTTNDTSNETTDDTTDETHTRRIKEEYKKKGKTKRKKVVVSVSEEEAINELKKGLVDGFEIYNKRHKQCLIHFFMTGYVYNDNETIVEISKWLGDLFVDGIGVTSNGEVPRAKGLQGLKSYLERKKGEEKVKNIKSSIRNALVTKGWALGHS